MKSPITFVTEFAAAESYRFFFEVGTDFEHELAHLPVGDCNAGATGGFVRGGVYGVNRFVVRKRVGGWRGDVSAPR